MKMKTGMKRNLSRIISFMMVFTLLSAYGCNKGKTIDPDFYPTQEVNEEAGEVELRITDVSCCLIH